MELLYFLLILMYKIILINKFAPMVDDLNEKKTPSSVPPASPESKAIFEQDDFEQRRTELVTLQMQISNNVVETVPNIGLERQKVIASKALMLCLCKRMEIGNAINVAKKDK